MADERRRALERDLVANPGNPDLARRLKAQRIREGACWGCGGQRPQRMRVCLACLRRATGVEALQERDDG